jgi:hypothetical protein
VIARIRKMPIAVDKAFSKDNDTDKARIMFKMAPIA